MIYGIGNDITEIDRIQKAMHETSFQEKCFTQQEINYMDEHLNRKYAIAAGNFSVKESVSKALGTGIRGFSMRDLEVLRDELGKPYIKTYGNLAAILSEKNIKNIFVSISDTKNLVTTFAILEKG